MSKPQKPHSEKKGLKFKNVILHFMTTTTLNWKPNRKMETS